MTQAKHTSIEAAFVAAQREFGIARKAADNPHFRSKYASLADVWAAVVPALNKHGIGVSQPVSADEAGYWVETIFTHESGGTMACRVPLLLTKSGMQDLKSAQTYARRAGLEGLSGVCVDDESDDDGNQAQASAPTTEAARARPNYKVTPKQYEELSGLLIESLANEEALLRFYGITALADLPRDKFGDCKAKLETKLRSKQGAE